MNRPPPRVPDALRGRLAREASCADQSGGAGVAARARHLSGDEEADEHRRNDCKAAIRPINRLLRAIRPAPRASTPSRSATPAADERESRWLTAPVARAGSATASRSRTPAPRKAAYRWSLGLCCQFGRSVVAGRHIPNTDFVAHDPDTG